MGKEQYDYIALKKWAQEYQPCYFEKIEELESGNKVVTISGVQMKGDMFLNNLKHAMHLIKNKKLDSRYKEEKAKEETNKGLEG